MNICHRAALRSRVIYCTQLCPIYTKSISDKDSTSSARWKRICEYMWEMHLPGHSNKVQLKPQLSYGVFDVNSRILQFWHWKIIGDKICISNHNCGTQTVLEQRKVKNKVENLKKDFCLYPIWHLHLLFSKKREKKRIHHMLKLNISCQDFLPISKPWRHKKHA